MVMAANAVTGFLRRTARMFLLDDDVFSTGIPLTKIKSAVTMALSLAHKHTRRLLAQPDATMTAHLLLEHAMIQKDAQDALARFRERFVLPEGVIYLDGNSLGPLPKDTPARLAQVAAGEWGDGLIRSWNSAGWIDLPQRIGDKIARLIGADAGRGDRAPIQPRSTCSRCWRRPLTLNAGRRVILSERDNFPTDLYMAQA